ncbi:MAG: DNA internalization-related competence protein ComEC/Rec2 [Pseudodesulfovibrio sp.]
MTDVPLSPRAVPGLLPWQSLFLSFVLGVFALRLPVPSLAGLGVLLATDTGLRGWPRRLPVLAFAACFAFGYGYAVQRTPDPVAVPAWIESRRPVEVRAVVDRAEPVSGGRVRIILRGLRCLVDGAERPLSGKLAWNWRNPDFTPAPGQAVTAILRVVPVRSFGNPGGWDYAWHWRRQGVFWRGWPSGAARLDWGARQTGLADAIKIRLRDRVARNVPPTPGGAMVRALATGDRSGLDEAVTDLTRNAGLAHTLALSGLHVGFVAAIGFALAWLVGRVRPGLYLLVPRPKLAVLLGAPLVLGYAWLGQPSPSLIRAAVMFAAWGAMLWQGRGRVLMDGLFFALAVIVFVSPLSVYDLSLEMSAVAVAGIGLLLPHLLGRFRSGPRWWGRLVGSAWDLLAVSVCAVVALMPLVSWYFGTFSPNILFNLLWLPVLGFAVMPLGLSGMILAAASWSEPAGWVLLHLAAGCADGLVALLDRASLAGWTPVFVVLRPWWPEMLGFALLLVLAATAWGNGRVRHGLAVLAVLGLLLLAGPHVAVMVEDGRDEVRVTLLDVGQGQAVLVAAPGGRRWLVDGGGGSDHYDLGEAVVGPALTWGRPPRLDGVFMTHPDVDHSHGLPFILDNFRVDVFHTNGMFPRGGTGERMQAALDAKGMAPVPLFMGDRVALGEGVALEVLHPGVDFGSRNGNERSLVLRLVRSGRGLALLTGDVEGEGLRAMLGSGRALDAEALLLPHHGSRTSLSPAFYRAVSPVVALSSEGYLNRYGFPDPAVVRAVGVPVVSTSAHGSVDAAWDAGNRLSMRSFSP